jgi:hypothetical protein
MGTGFPHLERFDTGDSDKGCPYIDLKLLHCYHFWHDPVLKPISSERVTGPQHNGD